ncbi:MAG: type II secretion system F family protein [Syntrophorhabdaceae bacterium]|nr:type II secretion system F family protein [Syntrophorhabdaceae bacterium]
MPTYRYKGISKTGQEFKGTVEAETPAHARKKLHADGIFTEKLTEDTGERRGFSLPSLLGQQEFLPLLTRQLATLSNAGVPLAGALKAVIPQVDDPKSRKVLEEIQEAINGGATFARAVEAQGKVFPDLYASMARAGEESGTLPLSLSRLADHLERQTKTKNRVRSALTYPVLMAVVASLVVVFLLTFVVPKIVGVFGHLGKALPLPTRILIGITGFLSSAWWALLIVVAVATLMLRKYLATERGHTHRDAILLRLPLIGRLEHLSALSRFARTLSTLTSGGIPVNRALKIVAPVVGNVIISDKIMATADRVVEGATLADALRAHHEIPISLIQMVAVGENSGTLGDMLARGADAMDEEIEARLSRLLSLLEPLIILVMGAVVAFIVVSVLLPLLDISSIVG